MLVGMNTPVPLRPVTELRRPPYLARAAFSIARRALDPSHGTASADDIARTLWGDGVSDVIAKAASQPAMTTGTWGTSLATAGVADFVSSLVPFSAAARLFDVAPRASLAGVNTVSIPYRSGAIAAADVPWIAQGSPVPFAQFTLTSVTLGPTHKLGIGVALTRETAESSSGEAVLTTMLKENAALSLDASLFSNTAGTTDRPAGILAGITATTAAAAGADAMGNDLANLANVIADDGAGLAYVAHPAQANAIRLRLGGYFPSDIPVWPTLGVAEGVIIALDPAAIVSAFDTVPEISASKEALIHMDTAPSQIGTAGSPNVVAAPTRSLFQTDCIAVRLILKAAWVLRAPGAVAWIQNVNW